VGIIGAEHFLVELSIIITRSKLPFSSMDAAFKLVSRNDTDRNCLLTSRTFSSKWNIDALPKYTSASVTNKFLAGDITLNCSNTVDRFFSCSCALEVSKKKKRKKLDTLLER
jgi:hypothetical protein